MEYYARSANARGERQLLRDHLREVGALAGQFAEEAGLLRELGEWAGHLHDLGKYSAEFQRHLLEQNRDHVVHSLQGAVLAAEAQSIECAYAVAAHHARLKCRNDLRDALKSPETTAGLNGLSLQSRAKEFTALAVAEGVFAGRPPRSVWERGEELALELRTRMLLSCLADADRLNAEAWLNDDRRDIRATIPALEPALRLERVLVFIRALAATATPETNVSVLQARREVLDAALQKAQMDPGFFSLTVPTGGGKTLASLAFALAHASRHGQRRIIFVVPFLTIIEQNAAVIRRAMGEPAHGEFILEHHTNAVAPDYDDDSSCEGPALRQRLLAENWDAPVVITSSVQFFESLFADHPTRLRKIHNIANTVIIFDEAQTFPPALLRPLTGMLRQLVEEYRCTAVICTATQPALSVGPRGREDQALLPPGTVCEIMPNPAALFDRLKRVEISWPGTAPTPLADVAAAMRREPSALAILNTKRDAAVLFTVLRDHGDAAFHLSTRMCPAHRRTVLAEVRRRLEQRERCWVASTQLVEAGVDVDFPAVWRAMGPLDSIAQAAGRCNREGRLQTPGRVTVFRTEDGRMPQGTYARGTRTTESLLAVGRGSIEVDQPATFTDYFMRLYNTEQLDEYSVVALRTTLDFPTVAEKFRLIDGSTTAVLVPYGDGARWCERVLAGEAITRSTLRQMQPHMVALYDQELAGAIATGDVKKMPNGLHVFLGDYHAELGLLLANDPLKD